MMIQRLHALCASSALDHLYAHKACLVISVCFSCISCQEIVQPHRESVTRDAVNQPEAKSAQPAQPAQSAQSARSVDLAPGSLSESASTSESFKAKSRASRSSSSSQASSSQAESSILKANQTAHGEMDIEAHLRSSTPDTEAKIEAEPLTAQAERRRPNFTARARPVKVSCLSNKECRGLGRSWSCDHPIGCSESGICRDKRRRRCGRQVTCFVDCRGHRFKSQTTCPGRPVMKRIPCSELKRGERRRSRRHKETR